MCEFHADSDTHSTHIRIVIPRNRAMNPTFKPAA